jgi:hypothetical protein
LTCPVGQEPNSAKISCVLCENGKYSNSSSGNICTTCAVGEEPNSTKSGCISCKSGGYSNFHTDNICKMCSTGFQPSGERDDCVECEKDTFSNPVEGVLCVTCNSIRDLDLCESVRGPSLEECFWIESNMSELEIHCVIKV